MIRLIWWLRVSLAGMVLGVMGMSAPVLGQEPVRAQPNDTVGIYRSLYRYSKDRKVAYFFYRALFNLPADPLKERHDIVDHDDDRYRAMEGKTIRSIRIVTLEPFGTSLTDSTVQPRSFVQKTGNALHSRTRRRIIQNYLLFSEGDEIDPLLLSESERLLRASRFVRDVRITFNDDPVDSCITDVTVTALDWWTLAITHTVTTANYRTRFTGYNMFGMGHRFSNRFDYDYRKPLEEWPDWQSSYLVPNIANTFLSGELFYAAKSNESVKGFRLDRPFFSPVTRQAGGISYENRMYEDSLMLSGSYYEPYRFTSGTWSLWTGHAFLLRRGKTAEEQSTRLVVSLAYTRSRYPKLSVQSQEAADRFQPLDLSLAGIGISNRKYFTDRYIYRFGEKEDVPTGRIFRIIEGHEIRGDTSRFYIRFGLGAAGYTSGKGYTSLNIDYGTFLYEGDITEGVFSIRWYSFSPLIGGGRWKARIFGDFSFLNGINRRPGDLLRLNDDRSIPGYRNTTPYGTQRLQANISAVIFNPFDLIGFRISPVIFAGGAMVGDGNTPLLRGKVYKGIGLGVAVTNIYLVNSTFRILFGYYPDIKSDPYRLSSFDVWEYGFDDFDFTRPGILPFQ